MKKMKKVHVRVGDNVKIITGFDKNKMGKVIKIDNKTGKIIVKGINYKFNYLKKI